MADPEPPDGMVSPSAIPVPDSPTVCGLPEALSLIDNVPLRNPVALGMKLTLTVQVAFTERLDGQLLLSAKSFGKVPVIETPLIVSVVLPVLDKVTD